MSKLFCDDESHIFHKWSGWRVIEAVFERGILFGKRAGEHFKRNVRARECEYCKKIEWKDL